MNEWTQKWMSVIESISMKWLAGCFPHQGYIGHFMYWVTNMVNFSFNGGTIFRYVSNALLSNNWAMFDVFSLLPQDQYFSFQVYIILFYWSGRLSYSEGSFTDILSKTWLWIKCQDSVLSPTFTDPYQDFASSIMSSVWCLCPVAVVEAVSKERSWTEHGPHS